MRERKGSSWAPFWLRASAAGLLIHVGLMLLLAPRERLTAFTVVPSLAINSILAGVLVWMAKLVGTGRRVIVAFLLMLVLISGFVFSITAAIAIGQRGPWLVPVIQAGLLMLLLATAASVFRFGWSRTADDDGWVKERRVLLVAMVAACLALNGMSVLVLRELEKWRRPPIPLQPEGVEGEEENAEL